MKRREIKMEEGAGSPEAGSPEAKTPRRSGPGPLLLIGQNVSRIAGLAGGLADGLELRRDPLLATPIRVLREIQTLAEQVVPESKAARRDAPEESSTKGSPS